MHYVLHSQQKKRLPGGGYCNKIKSWKINLKIIKRFIKKIVRQTVRQPIRYFGADDADDEYFHISSATQKNSSEFYYHPLWENVDQDNWIYFDRDCNTIEKNS